MQVLAESCQHLRLNILLKCNVLAHASIGWLPLFLVVLVVTISTSPRWSVFKDCSSQRTGRSAANGIRSFNMFYRFTFTPTATIKRMSFWQASWHQPSGRGLLPPPMSAFEVGKSTLLSLWIKNLTQNKAPSVYASCASGSDVRGCRGC